MIRNLSCLTFCFILASCTISPRRGGMVITPGQQQQQQQAGVQQPGPQQPGPQGPAAQTSGVAALNQLDAHLRANGFAPTGPAVRNSNMQPNGLVAYAIDAQPGRCYVAVALADPGMDLNMVLLDPSGRTAAHNVAPDGNPWIHICPGATGRHLARLQAASGQGAYYYILYGGPEGQEPQLATYFGSEDTTVQTASLDPATAQRLNALDQRLRGERFERVGEPTGVVLEQRQDRNFPLALEQGYCYAFATLGGPGARDTDVSILDGGGAVQARDVATAVDGMVQYCPAAAGTYTLRARMYSGSGPLFVAGWVQSQRGQATPDPAAQQVLSAQSTAGAGLDDNYRLLDADIRARGYQQYGDRSNGQLTEGQTRDFTLNLEGGKCYAILAVGDGGVRDLDLIVSNPRGQAVDRDMEAGARPVVRACPDSTGDYRIQVSMAQGQGNFVYQAYRWPRGTRGPFGLAGLIYVRLAEVTSLLAVEGYEPDGDFSPERARIRREGASARHSITLPAGQCYSILVVGGDGVNDLDVTLSQGNTQVATDGSRNAFPSVRHCTQNNGGRFNLEVNAANGSGTYFYQVFRRGAMN